MRLIDVYFWPTGNGKKITIMLEECGLQYRIIPVNIGKGDQHTPEYTRISPGNKMPAIVDHDADGGPLSIFESGAILVYLADKTGKYWPITFAGYAVNLLAVPAMALAPGWNAAGALILAERIGRAFRKPTVEAMLSYSTGKHGRGWYTPSTPQWTRPGPRWDHC